MREGAADDPLVLAPRIAPETPPPRCRMRDPPVMPVERRSNQANQRARSR